MVQRNTPFSIGEYYHLYNRGNDKRTIFQDATDYQRFLALLHLANSTEVVRLDNLRQKKLNPFNFTVTERLVAIGAYCLMPNHYHLLLTPLTENGVSQFMQKLGTGYSMYFNKRYERSGTLFEGKFKAKWIDNDQYLRYLYSYMYLNPMKLHDAHWKDRVMQSSDYEFLRKYLYSSYYDFSSDRTRPEIKILTTSAFPDYFTNANDPRIIADWFQQGQTLLKD